MLLLTGKYQYRVDSKRRVNIPASVMTELFMQSPLYAPDKDGVPLKDSESFKKFQDSHVMFHVTRGPNNNLFVYPRESFAKLAQRLRKHLGDRGTDDEGRRFLLETMEHAHPVGCDSQGRITVPSEHLDYAGISNKVQVIGVVDHLELWDPEEYKRFIEEGEKDARERIKEYGWIEKETNDENG